MNETWPSPPWDIKDEIIFALRDAINHLAADSYLKSAVGSYGDTLTSEEVLFMLRDWNQQQSSSASERGGDRA